MMLIIISYICYWGVGTTIEPVYWSIICYWLYIVDDMRTTDYGIGNYWYNTLIDPIYCSLLIIDDRLCIKFNIFQYVVCSFILHYWLFIIYYWWFIIDYYMITIDLLIGTTSLQIEVSISRRATGAAHWSGRRESCFLFSVLMEDFSWGKGGFQGTYTCGLKCLIM